MTNVNYSTEQKAIFNWFSIGDDDATVESKAGSGKTSTIIEGINRANCLDILYCVFSKKLQLEAEKKITNPNVQVSTYHSIGFKIILKYWKGVKASSFTEFGRVQRLYPEAPKQIHFLVASLVSYIKNTFTTVPNLKEAMDVCIKRDIDGGKNADWTTEKLAEAAIKSINLSLEYPEDKQISFDDMVFLPIAKDWVKPTYLLVVSDESQDLSAPQLAMLKGLRKDKGRICLVGDSRQSIFGFRGAVHNSIEKFQLDLNARKFTLSTSYRCPKKVIGMAQLVVPDIKAWDQAIEGELVTCGTDKAIEDIKVNDVILSRKNAPLMPICLKLLRKGKPAYIEGRDIGKTLIDIIQNLNANSINDFTDKLQKWADDKIAKATGWNGATVAATTQDQAETLKTLAESCLSIGDIEKKINSLFLDADYVRVPSVVCSTVHKAKGREFDNVYMLSDSFDKGKRKLSEQEAQEETNIYYVAVTRAKKKLVTVSEKIS